MSGLDLSDVDVHRAADVALDHVHAQRSAWARENRRPRALTARDALLALRFEAVLVWTAAQNVAEGVELTDDDRARLTLAAARIESILEEAVG